MKTVELVDYAFGIPGERAGVLKAKVVNEEERRSEEKVVAMVEFEVVEAEVVEVVDAEVVVIVVVVSVALRHSGGGESHQQHRHTGYRKNQLDTSHYETSLSLLSGNSR